MLAAVRRAGVRAQIGLVLRFSAVYWVMRDLLRASATRRADGGGVPRRPVLSHPRRARHGLAQGPPPHRRRHADRARRARSRSAHLALRPDRAPARLAAEPRRPSRHRGLCRHRARVRQRPARPAGQHLARHGAAPLQPPPGDLLPARLHRQRPRHGRRRRPSSVGDGAEERLGTADVLARFERLLGRGPTRASATGTRSPTCCRISPSSRRCWQTAIRRPGWRSASKRSASPRRCTGRPDRTPRSFCRASSATSATARRRLSRATATLPGVEDGRAEQREHDLVVAGELVALAVAGGRALDDVHLRAVVADEVHVDGDQLADARCRRCAPG